MAVKGRTGRVSTWRAIELRPQDDAALPVPSTPFVGHDIELGELRGLLEAVRESPGCQICTVIGRRGSASHGSCANRARPWARDDGRVGRCAAYGQGVTYRRWPTSSEASGTATPFDLRPPPR